jgi:hypothetical protein
MRILHLWAIALSLACLIQAPALAQPGERPGDGRTSPAIPAPPPSGAKLIFNKKVQEDLGLGSDQVEAVSAAVLKVRQEYLGDPQKLKELKPSEKAELLAKVEKESLKAILKAMGDVLKPEQTKRLKQIEFQQRVEGMGPRALLEADVAKGLQLTDKQKKLFASIFNQWQQDMGAALFNQNRDQIPALRKEAMDAVRKSLNDEQKKKLEALTGKPFAFPGPGAASGGLPGAPTDAPWDPLRLPGGRAADLLMHPSVRKELKLTEDQTKSIQQALDTVRQQFADKVQAVFNVPGGQVDPTSVADLSKKVESEFRKAIGAVLNAGQVKRFHQIELQVQGIRALQNTEVVAALKLTAEQKDRAKTLNEELNSKLQDLLATGRDQAAMVEAFQAQQKLRREAADRIPSLLTLEQQRRWEALTGKAFELEPVRVP